MYPNELEKLSKEELVLKVMRAHETIRRLNRRAQKSESTVIKLAQRFFWVTFSSYSRDEDYPYGSQLTYFTYADRVVRELVPNVSVVIQRYVDRLHEQYETIQALLDRSRKLSRSLWALRAKYGDWKDELTEEEKAYFNYQLGLNSYCVKCHICEGTGAFPNGKTCYACKGTKQLRATKGL
jgi:hypothetical protein